MNFGGSEWDEDILSDIFSDRDENLILQLPLSCRMVQDEVIWAKDPRGIFSVKSYYRHIHADYQQASVFSWNKIWSLKVPIKVRNFMWRACCNCLPTNSMLRTKRVLQPIASLNVQLLNSVGSKLLYFYCFLVLIASWIGSLISSILSLLKIVLLLP